MKVTIIPYGYLKAPFGREKIVVDIEAETTVNDVLVDLNMRTDLVVSVIVNDVTAKMDTSLNDGDIVKLIPLISGG